MSTLENKTIKELVAVHDAIDGVEPIGTWKGRKDLLIEKVSAAMKASRGTKTIREVAESWLTAVDYMDDGKPIGYTYDRVLSEVLAEFPEANTTVKCLRWYNTKLNSDPNVKMPVRPRKKAAKTIDLSELQQAADEADAEEAAAEEADRMAAEVMADPLA